MAKGKNKRNDSRDVRFRNGDALLRNLIENAAVPTFLADANGDIAYANRAFAELLGYQPSELAGFGMKDLIHPDDLETARVQAGGLVERRQGSYLAERRYLKRDGGCVCLLASAAPLLDEKTGATRYLTVQAIDIDGRKRAEAALAETEQRWNSALEAAGQGVWDLDFRRGTVFYSRTWRQMRGIGADEELDSSAEAWFGRMHPDDLQRVRELTRRQDAGEVADNRFEYRERHRDGHYIWILSRGGPVEWFPDGRPSRMLGTDTDITSLKKVEEALQFANTLLTTQAETSPDAILVVDASGNIISFNGRFAEMWGVPIDLLEAEDDAPVLKAVTSAMVDPEAFVARVKHYYAHPEEDGRDRLDTKDGRVIDRHTSVLRTPAGQNLGRIWFFRDITEQMRQQEERELQNFRFEAALNNMSQGLVMFDRDKRLVVSNRPYREMYRHAEADVEPGMRLHDVLRRRVEAGNVPIEGGDAFIKTRLAVAAEGPTASYIVEMTDGRAISIRHRPLPDGGWVATHEDITEQLSNQKRVHHLARHDPLTDLPNRVLLREHLEEIGTRVGDGEIIGVLCIDLDGFKGVNDTLGHAIGDAVLKGTANRLRELTRDSDVIARLGGDEFAIIEGRLQDPAEAGELAGRIVKAMAEPFDIDGHHILIGASVGIAVAPLDGEDGAVLMKNADLALYRAKEGGRGNYHFYEKGLDAAVQERRTMEAALRLALPGDQFRLVFQPLLNLGDNRICAFEALLRWEHPEWGYMHPAQFIPAAEESGLIVAIGEWVLREACAAAAGWPDDIGVAVNLSPVQFRKNRNLVEHVKAALAAAQLRADRLEVEVTESALLSDSDNTRAILDRLKRLGVKIAMDDFGTGYSSLSNLRHFPFDKIKIDKSFVQESCDNADSRAIVKAVISLGQSLGMVTTAEGVETEAQLSMIREQGCTEVQGFLFSAPLPPTAVADLLKRFRPGEQPARPASRQKSRSGQA